MAVELHPRFVDQFEEMSKSEENYELLGEVNALVESLNTYGHEIEGEADDDPSHPIVISRYRTYALRRTPPTVHTPYATQPPVIRIPYVWFSTPEGELPVVMYMGDKTTLGNLWYPRPSTRSNSG